MGSMEEFVHYANLTFVKRQLADPSITDEQRRMLASLLALGACPNNRCSILSESDSTLGHEQVFSPLEYRSDAAAAAECAGLRAERPCLAVYRRAGSGDPGSQGDHGNQR